MSQLNRWPVTPSLGIACKQKESLCERPHPVLTTLAAPGLKEKTAKAKQIQKGEQAKWVGK